MSVRFIHARMEKLSQVGARIGGAIVLIIAIMTTCDALMRKFFSLTLQDGPEISGYLFAVAVTLAFSFVFLRRANVRIDTLYVWLPPKTKAVLDVLGVLLFFAVAVVLTFSAIGVFTASWRADSRAISALGMPLWIPQLFWVAGMILFLVVTGFVTLCCLIGLLKGHWDLIGRLAGAPTVNEAIEEEASEFAGKATAAPRAD